ncbi:MAG: hypothetical protein ABEH35_04125 [Haloarculaceae archaeon]
MAQRHLYGGGIALVGVLLAAVQVIHALRQTTIPVAVAVDAVPFAAAGLGLAFVGYWLARRPAFEDDLPRIALWGVGGAVALASVAALILFSQRVTTGTLSRATFVAVDLMTVGAVSGVLVGLYDARSRHRLADLQRERDRIEEFAAKAADVNNYGRAINAARSIDAVGAYVVEAVDALVGFEETAVIELGDDAATIVASTIRAVDEETAADIATRATDDSPGDVTVYEDDTAPAPVDRVLTALVSDREGASVVVVSLTTEGTDIADEERQLLELIVSHATSTVDALPPLDRAE